MADDAPPLPLDDPFFRRRLARQALDRKTAELEAVFSALLGEARRSAAR